MPTTQGGNAISQRVIAREIPDSRLNPAVGAKLGFDDGTAAALWRHRMRRRGR